MLPRILSSRKDYLADYAEEAPLWTTDGGCCWAEEVLNGNVSAHHLPKKFYFGCKRLARRIRARLADRTLNVQQLWCVRVVLFFFSTRALFYYDSYIYCLERILRTPAGAA